MPITAIGLGVSVVAPIVAGAINAANAASDKKDSDAVRNKAYNDAYNKINGIKDPKVRSESLRNLTATFAKYTGGWTPPKEVVQQVEKSAFNNISLDPSSREAQMKALNKYTQLGEAGFDEQEQADINKLRRETAGQVQGKVAQIQQNMAQRGMAGSGNELIAQLQAAQSGANRASEEADRLKSMAAERKLAAIAGAGNLGGSIRSEDYKQAADLAKSTDEINMANMLQRAGVGQRDIDRIIASQRYEAETKQGLEKDRANTTMDVNRFNIGQSNKEIEMRRADEDALRAAQAEKAKILAGLVQNKGSADSASILDAGKQLATTVSGIGSGLSTAGSTVAGMGGKAPSSGRTIEDEEYLDRMFGPKKPSKPMTANDLTLADPNKPKKLPYTI